MLEQELPKKLSGDWIWVSTDGDETNKYCYFRNDIFIDQAPRDAEVLIAANSSFHLFINGKHIYFGESSLSQEQTYVHSIDISFWLEPGKNSIGLSVHNSTVANYNNFGSKQGGCWAEFTIDGSIALVTDNNWFTRSAVCLYNSSLAKTSRGGYTEKLNFNKVVKSWLNKPLIFGKEWSSADKCMPISELRHKLAPNMICGFYSKEWPAHKITSKGKFRKHEFSTSVEYSEIMNTPGCYMSESFFLSDSEGPVSYTFFCDSPYRMFLNGELIREHAVNRNLNGEVIQNHLKIHDFDTVKGVMNFGDGWNKIVIIQELETSSYGFTFNLDADPIAFQLLREQTIESLPGWSIMGPLKTPLDRVTGDIAIPAENRKTFYTLGSIDEAAYLESLRFTATEIEPENSTSAFTLAQDEFIVLDFGHINYALPQLTLEGSQGDILDITCSPSLKGHIAEPFSVGRSRNSESVILDGGKDTWIDFHPRGFRYLMISARKVMDRVNLSDISIKTFERDLVESSFFNSTDAILNRIWEISHTTTKATVSFGIMGGAEREHSQFIPDCMIQSEACHLLDGNNLSSLKALREFAAIQYESGEIPSMHPSAVPFHFMDFLMLYPEWIRLFHLYSGNIKRIEEFKSTLVKLFTFLKRKSIPGQEVIFLEDDLSHEYFIDFRIEDVKGVSTVLNALYTRALLSGAFIMRELGEDELAAEYEERSSAVSNTIRALCWSAEDGHFKDYWDNGELSTQNSWQTDILAIYGGITDEDQADLIIDRLFTSEVPYARFFDGGLFSAYIIYYVLEVLFMRGQTEHALKLMKFFWGKMATADETESWPELFEPLASVASRNAGSLCTGYGVSPIKFITNEIAGISPATPGYHTIYFKPRFDLVKDLKIKIPTPSGSISVEWKSQGDFKALVLIEANHPVSLIPIFSMTDEWEVEFNVSDSITVIED